jgi:GntR family transcriptional repressor for pyruvate dehydrogenase complex
VVCAVAPAAGVGGDEAPGGRQGVAYALSTGRTDELMTETATGVSDMLRNGVSTRLSDGISDQILRFIMESGLEQGARLPSERVLAERFDTSRPTVSQALRRLSLMGMVDIRRGSGVYVLRKPESMVTASVNLMLDLHQRSIDDLMEARLMLETVAVEHAAVRSDAPTLEQAKELEEALDKLVSAHASTPRWIAADTVFHAAVVGLADNLFLSAFYESVHTASLMWEYEGWLERNTEPEWLHATGPEAHRALHEPIVKAIVDHDVVGAREAVASHHEAMLRHMEDALRSRSATG